MQKARKLWENTMKPKPKKHNTKWWTQVKIQNPDFLSSASSNKNSFQQIQGRNKLALNSWAEKILKHDFIFNNASSICLFRGKSNASILTWVWFFYNFAISYSSRSKEFILFSMGISRLSILLLLRKELWNSSWCNQLNANIVRQISFHSDQVIHGILFNHTLT